MLGHAERRLGARRHTRHIALRHAHVDPQLFRVGDDEQFRAATGAGVDQLADIGFARGDGAVERHHDTGKPFHRDDAVDIGLRRLDQRLLGGEISDLLVDFLFGNRIRTDHRRPALGCGLRERGIGLRTGEIGARLEQLLIQIGRFDFGEQIASLHLGTDIVFPALQITAHARIDRRPCIRLDTAGQFQAETIGAAVRWRHRYGGQRLRLGPVMQARAFCRARNCAIRNNHDGDDAGDDAGAAQSAMRRGRSSGTRMLDGIVRDGITLNRITLDRIRH